MLFPFSFMQSQGAPLLLDLYPNSAVAYSLRKLRTAYTGSAIRVRRSSDNAEQNIGFSGNNLNTSALTTFCAGTNGFVTTWYDQSGNGANAIQTIASQQPIIVSGGSVININGKPSIDFSQSIAPTTLIANVISTNQFWTMFGVLNLKSIGPSETTYLYGRWFSIGNLGTQDYNNTQSCIGFGTNQPFAGVTGPPSFITGYNNFFTGQAISYNTQYLVNSLKTGNTIKNGLNNTLTSGFTQVGTLNATLFGIGANITFPPENNSVFKGNMQEIIYYKLDQSSIISNINTSINTYYNAY